MMISRLLPSLLCNDVQFGMLDMAYAVYIFVSTVFSKPSSLHSKRHYCYNLKTVKKTSMHCINSYTFTPHLSMGQVFTALTRDPRDPFISADLFDP